MRARFVDGPYNEVILNIQDKLDHVLLPVTIVPTLARTAPTNRERSFLCQAKYRLVRMNDYVATFQFEGIKAP